MMMKKKEGLGAQWTRQGGTKRNGSKIQRSDTFLIRFFNLCNYYRIHVCMFLCWCMHPSQLSNIFWDFMELCDNYRQISVELTNDKNTQWKTEKILKLWKNS